MDYVNVVAHIFQTPVRDFYALEELWGDAKITSIESEWDSIILRCLDLHSESTNIVKKSKRGRITRYVNNWIKYNGLKYEDIDYYTATLAIGYEF
jgi:hypothetical protein